MLERTLGVPIFQEQVIKLAMVAAGFTPVRPDQLRGARWRPGSGAAAEPYEQRLMAGMQARGYRREFAERVYRQILGFGDYGFRNRMPPALRCWCMSRPGLRHHLAAFCAALINSQPMGGTCPGTTGERRAVMV